jgi:hypothetical protein
MVAHTLRKSTFLVEVIELGRQDFLRQQQAGSPRPGSGGFAGKRSIQAGGDQDNRFKLGT